MASPGGNPAPLGLVTVTSGGTPVRITANFANMVADGILPGVEQASRIYFVPDISNTGMIYVGKQGMDKGSAGQPGVMMKIAPGQSHPIGNPDGLAMYNVHDFWLDSDEDGDSCYVFYDG